ncbi:MAG: polyprenol monophosphomannose synthase [Chloroflexia bacterium]|jgi:dolichol-phosphate mannosyltransferase|nr:polyprenol monophosphomannose synthase [Chloroflexia bacterium]
MLRDEAGDQVPIWSQEWWRKNRVFSVSRRIRASSSALRRARFTAHARSNVAVPPLVSDPISVTVVIPTYNERDSLPACAERILALGASYAIVVVDDNSPDGTGAVADDLAQAHPGRMQVIHRPVKAGLGPAYVAGLQAVLDRGAEAIVTMDADLSHDPAALPRLVESLRDHDLVVGSRYVPGGATRGWPLYRRLLSRFGGRYAAMVLGIPIADMTSGFKAFRPSTLETVDLQTMSSDGYAFNIEITYRSWSRGCRVKEVPIVFTDRVAGRSKLSRRIMAEAMVVVWRLRLGHDRPRPSASYREPSRTDRRSAPRRH